MGEMDSEKVNRIIMSLENDMNQSLLSLKATISRQMIKLNNIRKKYSNLDEQKSNISRENGVENPKVDDMIELNVSGRLIQLERSVLLNLPNSLLSGIFSGRWDKTFPKDSKGRFFLNENPDCFRYILNTVAGFSSSVVLDSSMLESIVKRYRLGNSWNGGEEYEYQNEKNVQPEVAHNFARFSKDTNPLERHFLELLDNFNSQKVVLEHLTKQYELDALKFEKEVALMEEIIEDGKVVLELNVGGEYVTTTQSTLQIVPDSMLSAKFDSSKWSMQESTDLDDKGNVLIDVDPAIFHNVLDYLRCRKLCQEEIFLMHQVTSDQVELLKRTLNYLFPGNTEIKKAFPAQVEVDSCLLSLKHQSIVRNWCADSVSLVDAKLSLIYRASRDGWEPNDFRSKCNEKQNTLTVISANGAIFGGFSNVCWNSTYTGYMPSEVAFLFSLIPPTSNRGPREPAKLPLQTLHGHQNNAVHLYKDGPHIFAFGLGHDLAISRNANSNSISYSNLGHTYCTAQSGYSGSNNCYFAGSQNFTPQEIECFAFD